jgi:TDG/mug DNA glycosylase family protein
LLVGINPGRNSGTVGHHFAGNGNPFWRLLHAAGLTPVLLHYQEDQRLAEFGIALTNLCARTTRTAAELTRAEIAAGREILAEKIGRWRPKVVAFVGVTLYGLYFPRPSTRRGNPGRVPALSRDGLRWAKPSSVHATPGPGPKPETIGRARVFVVPNPSGLNASFPGFAHKLVWFERLRAFVESG